VLNTGTGAQTNFVSFEKIAVTVTNLGTRAGSNRFSSVYAGDGLTLTNGEPGNLSGALLEKGVLIVGTVAN
jgi:hypothetical protein